MFDSAAQLSPVSSIIAEETFPTDGLLATLLNISLTGIILFKPVYQADTGQIIDMAYQLLNPAAQRMLDLPERPGQTFLQLYPHAVEAGIFAFYRDTFLSGEPGFYKVNYQNDKLNNYYHLAAQRSGQGLVVSFSDTADQDRSAVEQALRESQTREQAARAEAEAQRGELQRVFEQAPVGFAVFRGPHYVIELANPAICAMWGRTPEQALHTPLFELLPEAAGQGFEQLLDGVLATGVPYVAHELPSFIDRQGNRDTVYWNFVYHPLREPDGQITGITVVTIEVSEQVLARQRVQQLNAELETRVIERTQAVQVARAEAESQRIRLERLFMQAPAAICILDGPDLVFELVNPAYQQLFPGRPLLGKPILEALPEIVGQPIAAILQNVFQTGETFEGRELLVPLARYHNGPIEEFYFNFIYQGRFSEQGQVNGVVAFAFEITEQVKARQASEASAHQLKLITDTLPVLIGYLDQEKKYQFANRAYQAWFDRKSEELLGQHVREVMGEKGYQTIKEYMNRALAGEKVDFEAQILYQKKQLRNVRASYIPDTREGKVVGFYAMVLDITEQVSARQQLAQTNQKLMASNIELNLANQQLTHVNKDLDNFIYTASHDLKAPILNIEGLLSLLLEQLSPAGLQEVSIKRTTDLIFDSVERFKRTITHLTEITKLQKEHSPESIAIDLGAIISEVQLDLALAIQAAQAKITVDVTHCPTLRFSEKNLHSIVYNLLSNALKYHSPLRTPLVRVYCYETAEYQVLSVEDNGLGMDLSGKPKLFAMFKRLHNHVEGSGIGLYMVKKIIENAGGKIEVESKVDQGSTFRVYFPRHPA